jgi:recombination protein RecT
MTDTTVTVARKHPLVVLRERLEARVDELKASLPSDIKPERFIRALITAAQVNPDLLATNFQSLWIACMRACRDGLLPDGVEGAIVPYKEKATWIPMYRGLLKKAAPSMRWITTNVVYQGEPFEHWVDEHGEHLKHTPGDTFDESKIVRVYAMGQTKDGGTYVAVLSLAEIDKIRKSSRTTRTDTPWFAWLTEMMKKTALRRLHKLLPVAVELPDEEEDEETPKLTLAPVATQERGAAAALDLFAGSPEVGTSADAPSEKGETGGGVETGKPAVQGSSTPAAADAPTEGQRFGPGEAILSPHDVAPPPRDLAYRRGQEAKAANMQRKDLPSEYRNPERDQEADAWMRGFQGKPL